MHLDPGAPILDAATFQALYTRHAGALVAHFQTQLRGNRAEAEDIVQEAFCLAWVKRDTLRDTAAFRSWLHTIARNVMLGRMRKRTELASDNLDPAADTASPERQLDAARTVDRLREALADLPEEQREAVLLVRLQGLKFREAAEVLGVPENTVKTRVRRGLLTLAEVLDL